ncbi:MAG: hypothetical protein ABJO64_11275 [Nitratireductor sp.]
MSMQLERIVATNFRKFRDPKVITGLSSGLNVIIEPNETGKSTLLEALRAGLFVRHGTKNQLAQSFIPFGENVAPEIEIDFQIDGERWHVSKKFLKSPALEVRGPRGRTSGDAAEEQLQALLGFERSTSRDADLDSYGALGLLWVGQGDALSVSAPGEIVRNSVRSTLEAEVGSIMGGPTYDAVRASVDKQFADYWTPSGVIGSRQKAARDAAQEARDASDQAASDLAALERSFAELADKQARMKVLKRELADEREVQARADLVKSLETARAATLMLGQRKAERSAAQSDADALGEFADRHKNAVKAKAEASDALVEANAKRAKVEAEVTDAKKKEERARQALSSARDVRKAAKSALGDARLVAVAASRQSAIADAKRRHQKLVELEAQLADTKRIAESGIDPETMKALESLERNVATAAAELSAGSTIIELVGKAPHITVDGNEFGDGPRTIVEESRIGLGGGAELVIKPPRGTASAQASVDDLNARLESELSHLGVANISEARAYVDAARDAKGSMAALDARIEAITPAAPTIDLDAGADALRQFVGSIADSDTAASATIPDMTKLEKHLEDAEESLAIADGTHQAALEALRKAEEKDHPLAAAETSAKSILNSAKQQIATIEADPRFASLEADLLDAREKAVSADVAWQKARDNARSLDPDAIERQIERVDKRAETARTQASELQLEIARLEATIETEGGKGLAEVAAIADEEAEVAQKAFDRVSEEASTIRLLRDTLEDARLESSQTYVGPIARRAKRHIEKLLPGCDLSFTEDLQLHSITRAGTAEGCSNLSRGTQEQLAVLTRLAFADMLLEKGRPVSLILDDPLVYSDDARLDLMSDILTEAAERMQVILLTCRERAFRHLGGTHIAIG